MIKILSVIVLLSASIFAQNFEQFLDNALKNSPYLKASNLNINQAKERGDTLTRYANPTLGLEAARFSPNVGKSAMGYIVSYTQPLRLWGVGKDKENLSLTMKEKALSLYALKKARFIQQISLLYATYANKERLLTLATQELNIAKNIYEISMQRHKAGTISKGVLLQAQVDYEMVEVRIDTLFLTAKDAYYQLLKNAGINKEIDLDFTHSFSIERKSDTYDNPDLKLIQANQKNSLAEKKVNANKIEWVSVYTEYQTKPTKDIFRVGATIPLAIFNTKSQEKRISQLQANQSQLLSKNTQSQLHIEVLRLKKQRELLVNLEESNKKTLLTQVNLLKMFEQGYKIASVNLLQFQSIKNNLIATKKNIINLNTALDINAINLNYISGVYND